MNNYMVRITKEEYDSLKEAQRQLLILQAERFRNESSQALGGNTIEELTDKVHDAEDRILKILKELDLDVDSVFLGHIEHNARTGRTRTLTKVRIKTRW